MTEYRYWKWTNNQNGGGAIRSARDAPKVCEKIPEKEEQGVPISEFIELDTIHAEPSDKRAVCNERISSRYMIIQTPVNPFLKGSNYISDLKVQDSLLRPKDSNIQKE